MTDGIEPHTSGTYGARPTVYSPSEKVGMLVCSGLLIILSLIGLVAVAWLFTGALRPLLESIYRGH